MTRLVDPTELVVASEIAPRLGYVRGQSVHSVRAKDPSFPEPVKRLPDGTLLWAWPDVANWAATKTGRRGRPRGQRRR